MKSFDFFQTGPEARDCTVPYDIIFHRKMTVGEFVKEVLTRNEWGYIDIYDSNDKENCYRKKNCICSYSRDKTETNFPEDILDKKIMSATAHGGWTRMDYTLILLEE